MKKLSTVMCASLLAWTLAVYDRNGELVFARGGYESKPACDAAGAARVPQGGTWRCGETKTYRPKRY